MLIGVAPNLKTVSKLLSELGNVAFDGETDWADAIDADPRRMAKVKKLAMLLATIDAAILKRKERKKN